MQEKFTFQYCPVCKAPLSKQIVHTEERLACSANPQHYIHYDNPKPVVAAIIEYEGEVLLARNVRWPANWFALVTGYLEKGESAEEGIIREVKEEVGLECEVVDLVGVYPFHIKNEVIIAYHVKAEGEVELEDEIAEVKKIPFDKLVPWQYATGDAVRDWLKSKGITHNLSKTIKLR